MTTKNVKISPEVASEYLDMLDKAVDVGISILDQDLNYIYLNSAVYRELQIEPDQIGPGDSLQTMHNLMRTNGLLTDEIIEKNKISSEDQEHRGPLSRFTRLTEFADGRTHKLTRTKLPSGHTVSVSSDVTELIEKEKILEDSLHLGKAGYWVYDIAAKETWVSKNVIDHFDEKTMANIYKSSVNAGILKEDRALLPQAIKDAILSKKDKFRLVHRTSYKSGEPRYAQTIGEIIRSADGKPQKIRGFIKDIHKEHLQSLELVRAKDQALAASQAKSEFLANMSHEIRTPMNGILGMAELLANSNINEDNKEHVNVIYKSANALLSIINDILDFSKIEAGAMELDPMPFSLREVINDVASLMVQPAQVKGLELIVNYDTAIQSHFIGDSGRIRQILTNLVNNAIKFTTTGHVLLEVEITGTRDAANIVKLKVKDTGIGIDPAKLETIFDNFTQADNSTTRLYGGTGLGLSISKKLVEMMNGRVHVESTFGEGSNFIVTLPLPVDINAVAEAYDTTILQNKRVLIVDDIEVNCHILSRRLENWDMQTFTVSDAVEALTLLKNGEKFDLIISDYLMPGLNGLEFSRMMEKMDGIDLVPTIMISSCDQPVPSQELRDVGIEKFLLKPARETVLYDAMVKVLSAQPAIIHQSQTSHNLMVDDIDFDVETPSQELAETEQEMDISLDGQKVNVLVAEDFPLNQDVIRLMLSDSKFQPIFANNGQEAFNTYAKDPEKYSVILMDISMPVLDGYGAAKLVNEFETQNTLTNTPIIALTGHALKHDREKCLAAGMDDYLPKPVRQENLLSKLEEWHSKSASDNLDTDILRSG